MTSHSMKKRQFDISTQTQSDQPLDSISQIVWNPYENSPMFFTTSWDGFIRYYTIKQTPGGYSIRKQAITKLWQQFVEHPTLCCAVNNSGVAVVGLANGDILAASPQKNQVMLVGNHDAPICQIFYVDKADRFISLGFDQKIKIWNFAVNGFFQKEFTLPFKTRTAAYDYPLLLIGDVTSRGTIIQVSAQNILNINIPNQYKIFDMEQFSKWSCSSISANGKSALLGTVDGRLLAFDIQTIGGNYGRPAQFRLKDPLKIKSQKQEKRIGKLSLGKVNGTGIFDTGTRIGSYAYGTYRLTFHNWQPRQLYCTVESQYESNITAAKMCPKNVYTVYAIGNDWVKGLDSLSDDKKPKLKAIKFKSSEIDAICRG